MTLIDGTAAFFRAGLQRKNLFLPAKLVLLKSTFVGLSLMVLMSVEQTK